MTAEQGSDEGMVAEDAHRSEEGEEEIVADGGNGEEEDDDLDAMLANMDIDKDFDMWSNFRNSVSLDGINTTELVLQERHDTDNDGGLTVEIQDVDTTIAPRTETDAAELHQAFLDPCEVKWKERLRRDEIYSSKYRPSDEEEAELKELEVLLGIAATSGKNRFHQMFRSTSARKVTEAEKSAWNAIARPDAQHASLILKRGPCLLQTKVGKEMQQQQQQQECELILLTRGLVIASTKSSKDSSRTHVVPRQFYAAVPWSNVEFVHPSSDDTQHSMQWTVDVVANKPENNDNAITTNTTVLESSYTFVCADTQQRAAWLEAVEIVVVRHHEYGCRRHDLGWQYQYMYKPGYTMAVTNRIDLDTTTDNNMPTPDILNAVDDYNGLAALHYAVKYNHVPAIQTLLEAGADPDVKDVEGHTPMYWAVREELPATTLALLEQYGATKSETYVKNLSNGELFGKVAATEQIMEERHREAQQKKEAEAAAAQMAQNMKLLQQRGEQIDELGNKASDLNQGAQDYASMARQLKEASKKKSKWMPF
jgi:Ankyrin repeats (3 copies)/Synaptobrevin